MLYWILIFPTIVFLICPMVFKIGRNIRFTKIYSVNWDLSLILKSVLCYLVNVHIVILIKKLMAWTCFSVHS